MIPTVLLHGFAGHADAWSDVRRLLPDARALTLFGHDPGSPPARAIAFEDEVTRVANAIEALGAPVHLCGYSMGGRIALGVLARAPARIASAAVIGAHPGLATDEERRARIAADAAWIDVLHEEGIEAFADKWQRQALFASQAALPPEALARQRAIRLRHSPASLALAMESLGLGAMPSYWHVLDTLTVPLTIVVGARDEKFSALAGRMHERSTRPDTRVVAIADAGHNVVLEKPAELAAVLASCR